MTLSEHVGIGTYIGLSYKNNIWKPYSTKPLICTLFFFVNLDAQYPYKSI